MLTARHKDNWWITLISALLRLIAGLVIIRFTTPARFAAEDIVGTLLLVMGVLQLVYVLRLTNPMRHAEWIFLGLVAIFVGFIMLVNPLDTFITFTLLVACYFGLHGTFTLLAALRLRPNIAWLYVAVAGLCELFLSVIIWIDWSGRPMDFIAKMVGVTFLIQGIALTMFAFQSRHIETRPPVAPGLEGEQRSVAAAF